MQCQIQLPTNDMCAVPSNYHSFLLNISYGAGGSITVFYSLLITECLMTKKGYLRIFENTFLTGRTSILS